MMASNQRKEAVTMSKKLRRNAFAAAMTAWPMALAEEARTAAIEFSGAMSIRAAEINAEGLTTKPAAVSIVAYNGGPLVVAGYDAPVYLDLEGIDGLNRPLPLLRDHDKKRIVGTVEAKRVGGTIEATGRLVGKSADRSEVEELAADGYPWQASVGARPRKMEVLRRGQSATINGQNVTGPAYLARKSRLAETSIVTIGSDSDTFVSVAAEEPDEQGGSSGGDGGGDGGLLAIKAERARREAIEACAVRLIREGGDMNAIESAMNEAITNNVAANEFELQMLRKSRPQGRIGTGSDTRLRGRELHRAVEASVLLALGTDVAELEKQFPEQVLNAMDRHEDLRMGLGLQDLFVFAAEQRGERRVSRRNVNQMLHGAFGPPIEASGLSTFDLSGILSNVANKSLHAAFESVESTWREISAIGSVSDFKTRTSYSLTGDMTYEKVPPGGEIKHGQVGEKAYTNAADTYGKMFAIDRRDFINDDLSALQQVPRRLGRGAALKLNDVFWAEFLDNATFFAVGNNNYAAGAGTVLGVDSLTQAEQLFLDQKDFDGKPLALMPRLLLTATSNKVVAETLMNSTQILGPTTAKTPSMNPHANKFRALYSQYIGNLATQLEWYVLADPADLAVIEVVFLNGKQQPTVEQAQADFAQLGVQMRGYHDWGVAKQEPKGGVKMKGAA